MSSANDKPSATENPRPGSPDSATAAPTVGVEPPKMYRPADHESRIWKRWEDSKAFHADPERVLSGEAKPYSVVIPPPNVTAALHLGHALNNSIQDILVRAHRMKGYETLWMPGTDHAGIATQAVVEKRVQKEEKKRRTDFTREEFVAKIQAFKDEYEATITDQLKKMGCSCDWDRQRFTMDEVCAKAVREAFFRLFRDGLIYRGKRLVNWDPALQTAVADDECYDEEIDAKFYYLRYPLVHPHGATTQKERTHGQLPPTDPVPVTWSELESRGYPGAENHPDEQEAWVTVATTRPETYLADTAVAVNPHDPRAKALRGLCVELPLVGRVIPIVEDDYVVLPKAMARTEEEANDAKAEFATGFLKVTPAHDANDYELYQRHKERMDTFAGGPDKALINMMSPDGRVSDKHGWTDLGGAHIFVGKKMPEARNLVIEEFKARAIGNESLFEEAKPYRHSIKFSDRSKAVIEPYLSDQWYVKVKHDNMAKAANEALMPEQMSKPDGKKKHGPEAEGCDKELMFYPARYAKTYELWHDNIRDWCISRQLWWGHRIPIWRDTKLKQRGKSNVVVIAGEQPLQSILSIGGTLHQWQAEGKLWIGFDQNSEATDRGQSICLPSEPDPEVLDFLKSQGFVQDPDVLDTWFSSSLWPISTMGWPEPDAQGSTKDLLKAFNPTSALCTAREIITLWVSRMVMMNRYFMGEGQGHGPVPFHDVFIHAMIQDGEGRKMSKSLGNGVDPLDIIASHGADAMRFTLCQMTTQTQDVRMPVVKDSTSGRNTSPKFDLGRNFANKLWNAARFTSGILTAPATISTAPATSSRSLADRWMLSRLASAVAEADKALREYQFSTYAQVCYDLLWRDFCDWYLEAIKPTVASDPHQRAVLRAAMDTILRLLHPIMPFVTEAIFEHFSALKTDPVAGLTLTPPRKAGLLCTAGWPEASSSLIDPAAEAQFERLRLLVTSIREVRAQHQVLPKRRVTLHATSEIEAAVRPHSAFVLTMAGMEQVTTDAPPAASVKFRFESGELTLSNLADAVDEGAEKTRLQKQIADLEKSVATLTGRLANPGYADRAPPAMVQQSRDQLAKAQADLAATQEALAKIGGAA